MKLYNSKWYHRKSDLSEPVGILWKYLMLNRDLFPKYLTLALLLEIVVMGSRILFAEIIKSVESGNPASAAPIVLTIIFMDIVQLRLDIPFHRLIIQNIEYLLESRLIMMVMKHVSSLGVDFFSAVPASIIKSRIGKINVIAGLIQQATWSVITHSLQIVVSIVLILYYLNSVWGIIMSLFIVYALAVFVRLNIVMMRNQTPTRRRRLDRSEHTHEIRDWLIDTNTTLQTNSAIDPFLKMLEKSFRNWRRTGMLDFDHAIKGIGLQRDYVLMYGRRGALALSLLLLIDGHIQVHTLVLLNTVVETMFIGMWGISRFLYTFVHESESLLKLEELMSLQSNISNPENPIPCPSGPLGFNVHQVGFTYPIIQLALDIDEQDELPEKQGNGHLEDICLQITVGSRVGLVGPSGAGKSTLASLISGVRRPTVGKLEVNGVDINLIDPREIFSRVALVPQGTAIDLFNNSLRFNLCLQDNFTDIEIIEALKLASLWDTVKTWSKGLDEKIGERGRTLSGGQQQRVAIARALLRKPDLLILDEATSSLDPRTERDVQKAIDSLPSDITVLIIAHRLATIRNADQIVALQDGKVVGNGTWEEMLETCPLFVEMVELQNLA